MLRSKGYNGRVLNAGINGDTTAGMLARLDTAVPNGTRVVTTGDDKTVRVWAVPAAK